MYKHGKYFTFVYSLNFSFFNNYKIHQQWEQENVQFQKIQFRYKLYIHVYK